MQKRHTLTIKQFADSANGCSSLQASSLHLKKKAVRSATLPGLMCIFSCPFGCATYSFHSHNLLRVSEFGQGWSQNASEKARQLTSDDTSYRYSPWALVTIDEFNEFEPSSSSSKPITCAYEFGVPEASGWMDQDELFLLIAWLAGKNSKPSLNGLLPFVLPGELYQSGGAYQPELWEAEAVAKEWGREPVRPCWVRTQAASAAAGEYCATALKMPGADGNSPNGPLLVGI